MPKYRGIITSINGMGDNLFSVVFSIIALKIVNPDNVFPTITDKNNPKVKYFDENVSKNVKLLL